MRKLWYVSQYLTRIFNIHFFYSCEKAHIIFIIEKYNSMNGNEGWRHKNKRAVHLHDKNVWKWNMLFKRSIAHSNKKVRLKCSVSNYLLCWCVDNVCFDVKSRTQFSVVWCMNRTKSTGIKLLASIPSIFSLTNLFSR